MKSLRAWFASRTGRLVVHDAALAAAAAAAVLEGAHNIDAGVLKAAGVVGLKVLLRLILPVPGGQSSSDSAPENMPKNIPAPDPTAPVTVRTLVVPEHPGRGGRLGRHVHHDEQSRSFRVSPHPAPKSVVWSRHVKPFDQGDLGSCTGNAMAGALSTGPFPHHFAEATAVTLYKAATRLDDVPGVYPPDDTGSSGLAVAKAARARGWISSYLHCFTLDDVISALQDGPVIAGTNWYSGMDSPDHYGRVKITGTVRGGHEYEIVGVDLDKREFLACNSWGTSWGPIGGYFKVGFEDFARLLAEQGDVTVPKL